MTPTKEDVNNAMDVLKAAGCVIETKVASNASAATAFGVEQGSLLFVVYVPLNKMEDV